MVMHVERCSDAEACTVPAQQETPAEPTEWSLVGPTDACSMVQATDSGDPVAPSQSRGQLGSALEHFRSRRPQQKEMQQNEELSRQMMIQVKQLQKEQAVFIEPHFERVSQRAEDSWAPIFGFIPATTVLEPRIEAPAAIDGAEVALCSDQDSGYGDSVPSSRPVSTDSPLPPRKHKGSADFSCRLCSKKYASERDFLTHMGIHRKAKGKRAKRNVSETPLSPPSTRYSSRSWASSSSFESSFSKRSVQSDSSLSSVRTPTSSRSQDSSLTVATSPPCTPGEVHDAYTCMDQLSLVAPWAQAPSPLINHLTCQSHQSALRAENSRSGVTTCDPGLAGHVATDYANGPNLGLLAVPADHGASSDCGASLLYKYVKLFMVSDTTRSCTLKIPCGASNEKITSLMKESLGLPWNRAISLEDEWGVTITPRFETFREKGTVFVRPGPRIILESPWNPYHGPIGSAISQSSSNVNEVQWFGLSPDESDEHNRLTSRVIEDNAHHTRAPSRSISNCSPEGSEGEASFIGSVDSDDLAEAWEANLPPEVRLLLDRLVTQLVESYEEISFESYDGPQETETSTSGSQQTADSTSGSGARSKSSATSLGKHPRDTDDLDSDLNGNLQTPDRRKRRSRGSLISVDGRLLACPYCKYDPDRYSESNIEEKHYRGCSSAYLTNISRLKQHLYRVHKRPDHHCVSCFTVFVTKALLDAHTRARPPCEVQDPQFNEKMTFEQYSTIKRRVVGQDLAGAWYAIYETLFPGSPKPPSPYADGVSPQMVRSFVDHFNRQARGRLLELVRIELNGRLLMESDQQRILDSALEASIAQLVSISDVSTSNDGVMSPPLAPEPIPPPFQALGQAQNPPYASVEPPGALTISQDIYSQDFSQFTVHREEMASDLAPVESSISSQFYPFQVGDRSAELYPSYDAAATYFQFLLPDLPDDDLFDHDGRA